MFIHSKDAPYLVLLFNKVFSLGFFPESWSEEQVIPLHKKGSINEENNYRGITLLSTLGKLFTLFKQQTITMGRRVFSLYRGPGWLSIRDGNCR